MADTINQRFKQFRKSQKLSQVQLASIIGVSQGTITDIERGRIGVSNKVAQNLFKKFQLNQGWLYAGEGKMINEKNGIIQGENTGSDTGIDFNIRLEEEKKVLKSIVERLSATKRPRDYYSFTTLKRLDADLKKEAPELYTIKENLMLLIGFKDFIEDFEKSYLQDFWDVVLIKDDYFDSRKFDYKRYKSDYKDIIAKYSYLNPSLQKAVTSILQFYQDFKEFDTKEIIEDHIDMDEIK